MWETESGGRRAGAQYVWGPARVNRLMDTNVTAQAPGRPRQWIALAAFLGVTFAAAAVASLATNPAVPGWYESLAKPAWTPPNWLFGPAWTLLYISTAVAAWLVWRERGTRLALSLYAAQLVLNAGWPVLFFGLKSPGAALLEIAVLWAAVLATTAAFWRASHAAGWLMIPYLWWLTFAAFLNHAIWKLN